MTDRQKDGPYRGRPAIARGGHSQTSKVRVGLGIGLGIGIAASYGAIAMG